MRLFPRLGNCSMHCSSFCIHAVVESKQKACVSFGFYFILSPYHKYPDENWPEDEFSSCQVTLSSGEQTELKLAERGHCLSNASWVRGIRKLTQKGHQTSIIGTDYRSEMIPLAVAMFARWSQENFF